MSKSGPSGFFIARSDVVRNRNRKCRRAMILGKQDAQSVFEPEFFENDIVAGWRRFGVQSRIGSGRATLGGSRLSPANGE
jgi:hypothetical protein